MSTLASYSANFDSLSLNTKTIAFETEPIASCPKCDNVPSFNLVSPTQLSYRCDCGASGSMTLKEFFDNYKQKTKPTPNCYKHPNVKAVEFCLQCQKWMCATCLQSHNEFNAEHQRTTTDAKLPTKCKNHEKRNIVNYCINCHCHICDMCLKEHGEHQFVQLNSYLPEVILQKINKDLLRCGKKNREYYVKLKDEMVKKLNAEIKRIEDSFKENKEVNDNLMKYSNMLLNNYMMTYTIPNYHIINNLINNRNFNLKNKVNYINGDYSLQNEIDDLVEFYKNDFVIYFPTKMKWMNSLYYHTGPVLSLTVLNDGRLASCSTDSSINIYNTSDYKLKFTIRGHTDGVSYISQLEDGRLISASYDQTIKIWRLLNEAPFFECEATLHGHSNYITKVISIGNNQICSCSKDKSIKIWKAEAPSYDCLFTINGHTNDVTSVIKIKDGRLVSGSVDYTLRFWDISTGEIQEKNTLNDVYCDNNNSMLETKDGKIIVSGCDVIYIINEETNKIEKKIRGLTFIYSLLYARDGTLWCGNIKGSLFQYNLQTYKCVNKKENIHSEWIASLVTMKNDCVASCSGDKIIKIWKY